MDPDPDLNLYFRVGSGSGPGKMSRPNEDETRMHDVDKVQSQLAMWRAGLRRPSLPYGEWVLDGLARHMASGSWSAQIAIWRAGRGRPRFEVISFR